MSEVLCTPQDATGVRSAALRALWEAAEDLTSRGAEEFIEVTKRWGPAKRQ